ncbi:hypothetical protein [Streptomyces sp. NPDC088400]|uniref:hypothetical protein n=1 Tax=Streptomyces sp. NPDC088400 TaxID=3365861 RepID=UPI00380800D3
MIRRRMKFAAVLIVVVMALTGFSSSKGKGRSGSGSSGRSGSSGSDSGGGCSSSDKSNGSYSGSHSRYDDDDDDDYSSSGDSYTEDPAPTATSTGGVQAQIVTCVRKAKGKRKAVTYATVRVEVPPGIGATDYYDVDVTFKDASGSVVDTGDTTVSLTDGETKTLRVAMDSPRQVARVRKCVASATVES